MRCARRTAGIGRGMEIHAARIQMAVEQILRTEEQRDVLSLRVIANLTVEETANVMGKRTGAVKALQRRGLLALRRMLDLEGVSK